MSEEHELTDEGVWCSTHSQYEPREDVLTDDDRRFLAWCYERFLYTYEESENVDWMQRLAKLAGVKP